MQSTAARQSTRSRASAVQRRQHIIEATLRVMARDGLRAVSHRAVASEASVPLASTTYYFRDLEDLIIESFLHWSEGQRRDIEAFRARVLALLSQTRAAGTAEALADAASAYVLDQVQRLRDDRVLEYAFLHEAIRAPRLRAALGSPQPQLDAQITNSVLLGLEKSALLAQGPVEIRAVMLRHLQQALQPLPVGT